MSNVGGEVHPEDAQAMKIEKRWHAIAMTIVSLLAIMLLSWGVKAIWLSPEQEHYDCMSYSYDPSLVLCKTRDVVE